MDTNRARDAATTKPLPASLLLDQELARRESLSANGNLMTGCSELDDYLLLGGFERGSVVGVSAEEEEMGLLVSFFPSHLLSSSGGWLIVRYAARSTDAGAVVGDDAGCEGYGCDDVVGGWAGAEVEGGVGEGVGRGEGVGGGEE